MAVRLSLELRIKSVWDRIPSAVSNLLPPLLGLREDSLVSPSNKMKTVGLFHYACLCALEIPKLRKNEKKNEKKLWSWHKSVGGGRSGGGAKGRERQTKETASREM